MQPNQTPDGQIIKGVYTALITQSGTNDPTVHILKNTLGEINWTRDSMGNYVGTTDGLLTANKTWYQILAIQDITDVKIQMYRYDTDEIWIQTDQGGAIDGKLSNTPIEIRTYY